jgi:hypothetical protein
MVKGQKIRSGKRRMYHAFLGDDNLQTRLWCVIGPLLNCYVRA